MTNPLAVTKHQDIRPGIATAICAQRKWFLSQHGGFVNFHAQFFRRPNFLRARPGTLQMGKAPMTLDDVLRRKSGRLKMTIDVAGENKIAIALGTCPLTQKMKPCVGLGFAVQMEAMTIKAPGAPRIFVEPTRICQIVKRQSQLFEWWIGAPKPGVSTKIRQAGIDSHSGASRNRKGVTFSNYVCRYVKNVRQRLHLSFRMSFIRALNSTPLARKSYIRFCIQDLE